MAAEAVGLLEANKEMEDVLREGAMGRGLCVNWNRQLKKIEKYGL